jgi:hypothetical protein
VVVCTLKWLVVVYDRVGHLACGCGGRVLGMDGWSIGRFDDLGEL